MPGRFSFPEEVFKVESSNTRKNSVERKGLPTGSIQWLFQAISGAFVVFFLGVHLYVAHINGGSPVELFNTVVNNLKNPWWLAFFIAFVWIITYHAMNGVKGIVYEMGISARAKKIASYILTALFIILVIYGTALSLIVASMTLS